MGFVIGILFVSLGIIVIIIYSGTCLTSDEFDIFEKVACNFTEHLTWMFFNVLVWILYALPFILALTLVGYLIDGLKVLFQRKFNRRNE